MGASGLIAVAWWVTSRFPLLPSFRRYSTHLHTARALYTQPSRLPVPVGRHPGHCLLVTAPSAHHTTPHHTTPTPPPPAEAYTLTHGAHTTHTAQPVYLYPWVDIPAFCLLVTAPSAHHTTPHHTTPHHTTPHHTTPHHTTQHHTTQHNTTQHNTTQHNTTQHNTTQHNTTQHNTTQHNTTQHNTTQHNAT